MVQIRRAATTLPVLLPPRAVKFAVECGQPDDVLQEGIEFPSQQLIQIGLGDFGISHDDGARRKIAQSLQAINKRPKPKTFETFKHNFNDFCGQLGAYIANDQKIVEYMNKNKDFCALDEAAIASQVKDIANAQATRKKICSHPPRCTDCDDTCLKARSGMTSAISAALSPPISRTASPAR